MIARSQPEGLAAACDYVADAELRDAETVLAHLAEWFEDYDTGAPHSALGIRSPATYRADATLGSSQ